MPTHPTRRQMAALAMVAWGGAAAGTGKPLVVLINPAGRLSYLDGGQAAGPMPALFHEVAARAGLNLEVRVVPRARLMALVESGQYDLFVGTRTPSLAPRGDFLPAFLLRVMLLHDRRLSAQAPSTMAELMALHGWRGLLVRGVGLSETNQAWAAQLEAQRRLSFVSDWGTVVRMLLVGRAEFSFYSPTLLRGETAALTLGERGRLVTTPLPDLTPHEIGIYVGHSVDPAVRPRLMKGLEAALRDGVLRGLVQRAHPSDWVAQDLQFFDHPPKKDPR